MIKLRLLLEQKAKHYSSISQFKTDWKAMGNTIKVSPKYPGPDELNNGGDVNGSLLGIMIELFTEYGKKGVQITGGNDVAHIGMTRTKNVHELGQAIDIVPPNGYVDQTLDTLLAKYKTKYPGFSYINEFTNPSGYSTGGHYHIQYTGANLETPKEAPKASNTKIKPVQDFPTIHQDNTRVNNIVKKPMPNLRTFKP